MAYVIMLIVLSFVVGVSGGITSIGGILVPPVLIEFYGVSPHVAMGSTQASFIIPSGLAVLMFMRQGVMDWRMTWPLVVSGSLGTFISAQWIKPHLDGRVLTLFLALCIILAGSLMFRKGGGRVISLEPKTRVRIIIVWGFVVGMLTGLTGGGGNAMLVPTMVAMGFPILTVLGACQLFTVVAACFATGANIANHAIDLHDAFWLVVGQTPGIWVGVRIARRMDTELLKKLVGGVCVGAGLFILVKSAMLL